jgi:hypothetical protein
MGMVGFKKWVFSVVGILIMFVLSNYIVWKGFTEDILTFKKYYNGGLDRMAYVTGSKHYRRPETTLRKTHIENTEFTGQRIDVVTIGDSFSNAKQNGRDPLYQDWIATLHNLDVLNVQPIRDLDEITSVVILLNSGYLDMIKPRFIIIESVERNCIRHFSQKIDFTRTEPLEEIKTYYKTTGYKFNPPDVGFINDGNFKFLLYSILYRFSDRAFFSKVHARTLNASLFTVQNDTRLLFFHDDVAAVPSATGESMQLLNDNFNRLAELLNKKGITLYFMPAADKYNVYRDHIIDNPYPQSVFFELLRKLPKTYIFVDTKAMLTEEVKKGEKDVYYADDTHWSWKGSKKIAESIKFDLLRK